jgi:LacI family transcriptional regulator
MDYTKNMHKRFIKRRSIVGTTLKDIAGSLGISITSVSLVLNDKPNRISEEKQQLIRSTAKKMNYLPNQNAVGLVKKQSKTLGLIMPDISNLFFSELASGVNDTALEKGWNLIITSTNDQTDLDIDNIRVLASRSVDAIILVLASEANPSMLAAYTSVIDAFNRPVILLDRYMFGFNCSTISVNHKNGAYIAMKHLFDLGHRRIACLSGPTKNSRERLRGVAQAYDDYGIPMPPDSIFQGTYLAPSGYEAADAILDGGFTAVFSFNDMMAYGLYKRFHELGVKVPKDISIIGYDDIFFSDLLEVPLSSVNQPAFSLGQKAALQAFYEMEHPGAPKQTIYFEPALKVRKSTAPPVSLNRE